MCMSRLHRVLASPDAGSVLVEDMDGGARTVSLLAFEGPPLRPGDWIVAHSGYALAAADPDEAAAARDTLHPGGPGPVAGGR